MMTSLVRHGISIGSNVSEREKKQPFQSPSPSHVRDGSHINPLVAKRCGCMYQVRPLRTTAFTTTKPSSRSRPCRQHPPPPRDGFRARVVVVCCQTVLVAPVKQRCELRPCRQGASVNCDSDTGKRARGLFPDNYASGVYIPSLSFRVCVRVRTTVFRTLFHDRPVFLGSAKDSRNFSNNRAERNAATFRSFSNVHQRGSTLLAVATCHQESTHPSRRFINCQSKVLTH